MKYILKASAIYFGLSTAELKVFAYQYAKKINVDYPKSWDDHGEASRDWYGGFMHRHKNLSLRTPEQISANRANAFNEENVNAFFRNLGSVLDETTFEPHRIWNMDETGCPTVPTKAIKVIAPKGSRRVGQKTSGERGTNVTMALAVSATGQSIPPFFIFPRKNMQKIFMVNVSDTAVGAATESGWMNAEVFVKYMEHFIKHTHASKESLILLVLDNHTSHLSVQVIDMAIDAGITMISFPPHCSHRMQPLDVSVFGPFKTFLHNQCQAWMKNRMRKTLEVQDIAGLADKCLDLAATPRNIKAGFRATGIYPYDPNVFTAEDFLASKLSGENQCSDDDDDDPSSHRIIVVNTDAIETGANEEVTTSASEIASTSTMPSTSGVSLRRALEEVSPLQHKTPTKKSNRGRKPMKTTILTSAENVEIVRKKADEKRAKQARIDEKKAKKAGGPPAKRSRRLFSVPAKFVDQISEEESEEEEFCIICKGSMPKKMNKNNTIHCIHCDRAVHLKCANLHGGLYTCVHCESD